MTDQSDKAGPRRGSRPSGGVTAAHVAKAAGVSKSAVSRTFSPTKSNLVAESRRRSILAAAARLGYRPNRIATSLARGGKSGLVGVLIGNFANPIYLEILGRVTHELKLKGLNGIVFNTEDPDDINDAVRLVLDYQVDGLLVTSTALTLSVVTDCQAFGTPIVSMFGARTASGVTGVEADNEAAGRLMASHLVEHGARRVAFIGSDRVPTSAPRLRGFQAGLEGESVELVTKVEASQYSYTAGHQVMRSLFGNHEVDTIFCADDNLALGAMDVARHELGQRVPDDLMVAGFDDIPAAAWRSYNLTTISQPIGEIVSSAVGLLSEQIEVDVTPSPTSQVIAGELVARGSTGRTG